MALTYANEVRKAALDGITALFNGGGLRLDTSGDAELARLVLNATAFGAATTASPSVAASNSITADASVTAGTFTKFRLETSASALRINGTVGVGSGDLQVTSNVIPGGTTSVTCTGGITLSLTM